MKLIFNPDDSYIHKVLVVAYEKRLLDALEFEAHDPFGAETAIWQYTPLGKAPVLVMDDRRVLYGGLAVCEYLDWRGEGPKLFPQGEARWGAVRIMMLGDGMFDATASMRVEGRRARTDWHMDHLLRERRKVLAVLDQLERDVSTLNGGEFDIGDICVAGGLSYLDARNPIRALSVQPGDERFSWRDGHPKLAAWYDQILKRPSIAFRLNWQGGTPVPTPHS